MRFFGYREREKLRGLKPQFEYDSIEYVIAHDWIEADIAEENILLNMYATPRPLTEAIAA